MGRIFIVPVFFVIKHLVFQTQASAGSVFDSTVSGFGDFPFEGKFEILELTLGYYIPAGSFAVNHAVLDLPSLINRLAVHFHPLREVIALEQIN